MAQEVVKDFLTGGSNALLDENMYRLAEAEHFVQDVARHLINLSTFTVL